LGSRALVHEKHAHKRRQLAKGRGKESDCAAICGEEEAALFKVECQISVAGKVGKREISVKSVKAKQSRQIFLDRRQSQAKNLRIPV
jgi:hypothetical protein